MSEVYCNAFQVTLASAYTVGSVTLSVSAAAPAAVQSGTFRIRLGNSANPAQNTLLKVTNAGTGTTWSVTAEANDANWPSGTTVYGGEITAGGFQQALADRPALFSGNTNPNGQGADFAPHNMTSDTAPSPYLVTESSGSYYPGYRCFDGADGNNGVWDYSGFPAFVQLDLGSGRSASLGSYAIKTNTVTGFTARCPKSWTISGSNDGTSFTTVDTQTNQTGWATGETRSFTLSSASASYRYWKISVSANNGDSYTEINELYFYSAGVAFSGGNVGDFFLDTNAKVLYGPKQSSGTIWPRVGSLN